MTSNQNFKLYDIFREDLHLPDTKARDLVTALDDFFDGKSSAKIGSLATREELLTTKNELKQEIHSVAIRLDLMATRQEIHTVNARLDLMATKEELYATKNELKQEIHSVATRLDRMATKEELSDVKSELTSTIHETELRLTRNMYGATLAQMLLLVGSVYTILKYAGILK